MKLNNYFNEVRTLILYSENAQNEHEMNPYKTRAFFITNNMLDDIIESYDDYYKMSVADLVECKNNPTHIKAKQKKQLTFVVWLVGKYGDVYGVLYVPSSHIKEHKTIEEKRDMRGDGCIDVSYHDKIIFDDSIKITCKDSAHYFAKPSDTIKNINDDIDDLDDCIKKEQEHAKKYPQLFPNCERLITFYKKKQAQGFKYRCFAYRYKDTNYKYLMLYNCVDHYEKTGDYIKAEKLTEQIKKINNKWDVDDTIKLLKIFKLTKTRKGGK